MKLERPKVCPRRICRRRLRTSIPDRLSGPKSPMVSYGPRSPFTIFKVRISEDSCVPGRICHCNRQGITWRLWAPLPAQPVSLSTAIAGFRRESQTLSGLGYDIWSAASLSDVRGALCPWGGRRPTRRFTKPPRLALLSGLLWRCPPGRRISCRLRYCRCAHARR